MTFSNAVTTVTRELIIPTVFDTVTKGSPLLMTLLKNAKPWKTGTKYDVIWQYQDTTNGGNTGIADVLDTDRQDTRITGSFEVKQAYKPVVIADIEQKMNQGDERILPLLETEFDTQAKSLANVMAANLFSGTGVGNAFDSLANAADDSTNYSTYGGKSRSTYTTLKGYYLGSAGALTLNKMATAYDAVEIGTESPTMIVTTKSLWSSYEALLAPTVRHNYGVDGYPMMDAFGMVGRGQKTGANGGFNILTFRGTPVVKDEQCPSGKMFLVNTNVFGFKGVDMSGIDGFETLNFKKQNEGVPAGVPGRIPSTRGFNFRALMHPHNQFAQVGFLSYVGNFICENPRLMGQMSGLS